QSRAGLDKLDEDLHLPSARQTNPTPAVITEIRLNHYRLAGRQDLLCLPLDESLDASTANRPIGRALLRDNHLSSRVSRRRTLRPHDRGESQASSVREKFGDL